MKVHEACQFQPIRRDCRQSLGAGFLAGTGKNNAGPLAWSVIDFFRGNLGCLACGAFASVGVTVEEWKIGTADIDSQVVIFLDGLGMFSGRFRTDFEKKMKVPKLTNNI